MNTSKNADIKIAALYVGCIAIAFRILVIVLAWAIGFENDYQDMDMSGSIFFSAICLNAMIIPAFCITPSKNRIVYSIILAVAVVAILLFVWRIHGEIYNDDPVDPANYVDPYDRIGLFLIRSAYCLVPFVIFSLIGWRLNRKPLFLLFWAGILIICDIILSLNWIGKYLLMLTVSNAFLIISAAILLYGQTQKKNSGKPLSPPEDY